MKKKKEKKDKPPKAPLKQRIKQAVKSDVSSGFRFLTAHRKSLFFYGLICFSLAVSSIILTGRHDGSLREAPLVFINIIPRLLTLFIFTAPSLLIKKRRAAFAAGAGLWFLWQAAAAAYAVHWLAYAAIAAVLITAAGWYWDVKKPILVRRYPVMIAAAKWFYAFTLLVLVIESIHRMNPGDALVNYVAHPDICGINLLTVLGLGSFIFLIPKRKLTFLIYSVIWLILAYASYLKWVKVSEPVLLLDIFSLGEGISAMFSFLNFLDILFIIILLISLIVGIRVLARKEKKAAFRFRNLAVFLTVLIFLPLTMIAVTNLSYARLHRVGENTKNTFFRCGFAYSFLCSSVNSGVQMPADYSASAVEKVLADIEKNYQSRETADTRKPTNVIVLQMESFVDVYRFFDSVNFEYDPLPFLHQLQEEYSSGKITVPVFGGQTVKSEFEFITGLSMANLPTGYNPYVQYIKNNPVDSFAKYMKDSGYTATAIHNYQGEFFNRDNVYYYLDFDRFIPCETMPYVRRRMPTNVIWGGDDVLKDEIAQVLDASENGDFVFTVTVQLHGSYNAIPREDYPMELSLPPDEEGNINEELEGQIAYYTGEMLEFDKAIRSIVSYLEERGEPTFLLMYADHLPTLCNETVAEEDRFTTQYYTWNNMGIKKDEEERDMPLYTLSTYLCEELGIDGNTVNRFHSIYTDKDSSAYKTDFSYLQYYKMYEEKDALYGNRQAFSETEAASQPPYDMTFYAVGAAIVLAICIFAFIASGKNRSVFIICSVLLVLILTVGLVLLIPSAEKEEQEAPDNSYKNENYIISAITPIRADHIILSDELLIVQGDGFSQDTYISISGKNYPLLFVDEQTLIYRGFDAPMDANDIIRLSIIGERNGSVFTETDPFPPEKIEYGLDILPQNVRDKLAELDALEATPDPETITEEEQKGDS